MAQDKPFILTKDSYFHPDRPHISNSMISDYIKDPYYYYLKHVKKTLPKKQMTPAMKLGAMVDDVLTTGETKFQLKVLKKDDPELFEEQKTLDKDYLVTSDLMEKALDIINVIKNQPLWRERPATRFQVPLEGTINNIKVCGLADRMEENMLIDLKVSNPKATKSAKSWHFHALQSGYYRQLALYRYLSHSPTLECFNLTATYHEKGRVEVKLFKAREEYLEQALDECFNVIKLIKQEKFDQKRLTWCDYEEYDPDPSANFKQDYSEELTYEPLSDD